MAEAVPEAEVAVRAVVAVDVFLAGRHELVNARGSGMRCDNDRCAALSGSIGEATACTIYAIRPEVCRTCMPGDAECAMARRKFGLPVIEV